MKATRYEFPSHVGFCFVALLSLRRDDRANSGKRGWSPPQQPVRGVFSVRSSCCDGSWCARALCASGFNEGKGLSGRTGEAKKHTFSALHYVCSFHVNLASGRLFFAHNKGNASLACLPDDVVCPLPARGVFHPAASLPIFPPLPLLLARILFVLRLSLPPCTHCGLVHVADPILLLSRAPPRFFARPPVPPPAPSPPLPPAPASPPPDATLSLPPPLPSPPPPPPRPRANIPARTIPPLPRFYVTTGLTHIAAALRGCPPAELRRLFAAGLRQAASTPGVSASGRTGRAAAGGACPLIVETTTLAAAVATSEPLAAGVRLQQPVREGATDAGHLLPSPATVEAAKLAACILAAVAAPLLLGGLPPPAPSLDADRALAATMSRAAAALPVQVCLLCSIRAAADLHTTPIFPGRVAGEAEWHICCDGSFFGMYCGLVL